MDMERKLEEESINFEFPAKELMLRILKSVKKLEDKFSIKYNLSHFHTQYITFLNIFGRLTLTDLTHLVGADKANTTRVIKDLKDKGDVE